MSFFLWSACRHPENSTPMALLLSNFEKIVEKFGRVPHDEYNSLQGQKAILYPPNLPSFANKMISNTPDTTNNETKNKTTYERIYDL